MSTEKTPEQIAHEINLILAGQQIGTVAHALSLVLRRFGMACGSTPMSTIENIANDALLALGYRHDDMDPDRTIN